MAFILRRSYKLALKVKMCAVLYIFGLKIVENNDGFFMKDKMRIRHF